MKAVGLISATTFRTYNFSAILTLRKSLTALQKSALQNFYQ